MSHKETASADAEAPRKKPGRTVKPRAAQAAPEPPSPAQVADLDWQRDYFARHRADKAQIPRRFAGKTLDSFEARGGQRRMLVENARIYVQGFNSRTQDQKGLLLTGPVGCGKSHIAVAILREVINKGFSGLYYNSPDLLRDIRATFDDGAETSEDQLLELVTSVDLLVLDDLGAENVSGFVLDRFYLIVNKRYEECKPIIVTTNLDEETLRNRMNDRIVSRFAEMCERFGPFPNEDFRRRFVEQQSSPGKLG